MKKRIFIAINLPKNIKRKLSVYQEKWPKLPIKWVKPNNLHITLVFIGSIRDEELSEVCKITKEAVSENSSFSINLNKIYYGPLGKFPPRMIWAGGERIKELADLKNNLEKSLIHTGTNFISENRNFKPHITLGRIRQWEWRQIDPEEIPEINQDISLSFNVDSIEVMESQLSPKGSKYTILESVKL